jgi:hypothetical protein
VPLVAVILFFALYPQFALHRSEGSVKQTIASVRVGEARSRLEALAERVPPGTHTGEIPASSEGAE